MLNGGPHNGQDTVRESETCIELRGPPGKTAGGRGIKGLMSDCVTPPALTSSAHEFCSREGEQSSPLLNPLRELSGDTMSYCNVKLPTNPLGSPGVSSTSYVAGKLKGVNGGVYRIWTRMLSAETAGPELAVTVKLSNRVVPIEQPALSNAVTVSGPPHGRTLAVANGARTKKHPIQIARVRAFRWENHTVHKSVITGIEPPRIKAKYRCNTIKNSSRNDPRTLQNV